MLLNPDFERMLRRTLPDRADRLIAALGEPPVVSVRLNPAKTARDAAMGRDRVLWWHDGFYLAERPQFTFDPHFHAGDYYVQDASSMFIAHVIKELVHRPVRYLDLCAAPGGKTTAALDALPEGSLVVANDVVAQRAAVLADNVARWGEPATLVTGERVDTLGRLTHYFDVIAADVPCSGEGMMRKDSEAVAQWSPALVAQCAARQRQIIDDIWPALSPGGLLIYSTCTYNRDENEAMVEHIAATYGAQPVEVTTESGWGITGGADCALPCYRFLPGFTRGEGLFLAVLRKPDAPTRNTLKIKRFKNAEGPVSDWVPPGCCLRMPGNRDDVVAFPEALADEMQTLAGSLRTLSAGVAVATLKGRKAVPAHALALSQVLARGALPTADVDYARAVAYLRGEAITVDAPKGIVVVAYEDSPLGFANNLGNRANNLYPKPLRIQSTHIPLNPPEVMA